MTYKSPLRSLPMDCLVLLFTLCISTVYAGDSYRYSIDLAKVKDHTLPVELYTPHITTSQVTFSMPKMVPGTYSVYDFGRFASDFHAYDNLGHELPVAHLDTNSWEISNATTLSRITYRAHDTYGARAMGNPIFEPAGTDYEPETCYVLNLHTMLGYFKGHTKQQYDLQISHSAAMYGSSSLVDVDPSASTDLYHIASYNDAVDNPIMYTRPDTAHIRVGMTDVLISVYSPAHKASAHGIASQLDSLLQVQAKYLGGGLPVERYSFLIYLADHAGMMGGYGALEHSYCSMYYLIDGTDNELATTVRDVAAHEFFHIVTPLNIHSREIADFDFDKPVMSEHLWLYEGSTEYHAHSVQVKYGLISPEAYIKDCKQKMDDAQFNYNDSLSFTEMSKGCLDTFKDQYQNVYAKGALISLCMDLKLLQLSKGKYGITNLLADLSKKYGKDRAFMDKELFDTIVRLTYPEIGAFIQNHIVGGKPLPFAEVLGYAGVDYTAMQIKNDFSLGQFEPGYNPRTGRMLITGVKNLNAFGKQMGYQAGDEMYKFNGKKINARSFMTIRSTWASSVQEGDKLTLIVFRKNESGETKKVKLSARVFKSDIKKHNIVKINESPTQAQAMIRKAWLEPRP
jgi:predicted metalloprotease with PDZ domain